MTGGQLANELNTNGYKTNYNTNYKGGRGTYKLVHAAYDYFVGKGMSVKAHTISKAFVKANGEYAYK